MPDALRFLILTAAGWVNRHQEEALLHEDPLRVGWFGPYFS